MLSAIKKVKKRLSNWGIFSFRKFVFLIGVYVLVTDLLLYFPYFNVPGSSYEVRFLVMWFLVLMLYRIPIKVLIGLSVIFLILNIARASTGLLVYTTLAYILYKYARTYIK